MKGAGIVAAALVFAAATPASGPPGLHGYVSIEQVPVCRSDPCEDPVQGAKVIAVATDGRRFTATTNARGFYRLALASGRYSVVATEVPTARRVVARRVLVRSGTGGRLDFHLTSIQQ